MANPRARLSESRLISAEALREVVAADRAKATRLLQTSLEQDAKRVQMELKMNMQITRMVLMKLKMEMKKRLQQRSQERTDFCKWGMFTSRYMSTSSPECV